MHSRSTPLLNKHKHIRKTKPILTQLTIPTNTYASVNRLFLEHIRKIASPAHPNPTNELISFLNLKRNNTHISMSYIPSIENMIS